MSETILLMVLNMKRMTFVKDLIKEASEDYLQILYGKCS